MDSKILNKAIDNWSAIHTRLLMLYQEYVHPDDTVLDIGCGLKMITRFLKCRLLTGIEIWQPYLEEGDIWSDVTELDSFSGTLRYDVVMALDLIEHLEKDMGIKLIFEMLKMARKRVIIFTPTQWTDNKAAVTDKKFWSYGNPYNEHKSLWTKAEFKKLGFLVLKHPYQKDYIIAVREK